MEHEESFEELIRRWKELEDRTSENAEKIIEKTGSKLIKLVFEEIRLDTEKHKIILERLEEFKDEEIDREDLRCLDSLLADHERIEMESIEIGNRLLTSLRTSSVISKIIYHLIDDERKHHGSLKDLLLSIYIPEESFEYV